MKQAAAGAGKALSGRALTPMRADACQWATGISFRQAALQNTADQSSMMILQSCLAGIMQLIASGGVGCSDLIRALRSYRRRLCPAQGLSGNMSTALQLLSQLCSCRLMQVPTTSLGQACLERCLALES